MSDLNDQLRSYIDTLAEPVSIQEITAQEPARARSHPVPVAMLAGAAVVLIPALILLGIRLWPESGPVADPATIPPIVSTDPIPETTATTTAPPDTATTTTADTAMPPLLAPDLVGLTVEEAAAVLEELGLQLEVVGQIPDDDRAGVLAQDPEPGTNVPAGASVLVDVAVYPECLRWSSPDPVPGEGELVFAVLFECAGPDLVPGDWVPVPRVGSATTTVFEAILQSLLAGPTEDEARAFFISFFSSETADALNSVALEAGQATVDFNDGILVNNASTSTGSEFFLAELQANLFQLPEVDSIEFRLNGSCDSFWNWLQRECRTVTRAEWNAQLESWDNERENS